MKRLFIIILMGVFASRILAQGVTGFFSQSETRLKDYAEQIAALQVYIADAEKGYKIAESGLQTIGSIKTGEFNLHSVFFASLKTVSPAVKNMTEVAEIIALQAAIVQRFSTCLKNYQKTGQLSGDEVSCVGKVYSTVVSAGIEDLNDLLSVLTDGQLEMGDGERMRRIQAIDADMRDQMAFTSEFTGQTDLLSMQRTREQSDAGMVGALYGVP